MERSVFTYISIYVYIGHSGHFDIAAVMALQDVSTQAGCGSCTGGSRGANDVKSVFVLVLLCE